MTKPAVLQATIRALLRALAWLLAPRVRTLGAGDADDALERREHALEAVLAALEAESRAAAQREAMEDATRSRAEDGFVPIRILARLSPADRAAIQRMSQSEARRRIERWASGRPLDPTRASTTEATEPYRKRP